MEIDCFFVRGVGVILVCGALTAPRGGHMHHHAHAPCNHTTNRRSVTIDDSHAEETSGGALQTSKKKKQKKRT